MFMLLMSWRRPHEALALKICIQSWSECAGSCMTFRCAASMLSETTGESSPAQSHAGKALPRLNRNAASRVLFVFSVKVNKTKDTNKNELKHEQQP